VKQLEEKIRNIKILAMDFDGVLTDNRVITDENGIEMVICNRSDSLGLDLLKKRKKDILITVISKEKSKVVRARCKKLNIDCIQGIDDKLDALRKIVFEKGLLLENVVFIGNDLNDLECIKSSGLGVAVSDSNEKVLEAADIITKKSGGRGAVREFIDLLLDQNRVKTEKTGVKD
jgi:YrbI family 3-deoxy-D-manno-octulosonate 8-phosphate phosphatase